MIFRARRCEKISNCGDDNRSIRQKIRHSVRIQEKIVRGMTLSRTRACP